MVKNEKGQSIVEFALVIPVMLLLMVGLFDFGRVFYMYTHYHLTSQETVRVAGLGWNDSDVTQFAKNYIHIGEPADLEVTITPNDTNRNSGDYVTVQLKYPATIITPLISSMLPSPFYIETESTIRVE
ncbi:pilus assembly protein TadE [Lottiidibacillus patelloidae]|uniref:Pilus assembly protein TadE n=1 Tax=Lottiidibacillus patelloidae TaxID=2670334 RepID=A0A263BYJ4_9BACI|nr:TadE family protein [Lottiidibacillus patelloidae]OZM58730.1 pilus assembly protein TadE [Lottiidibacillus patelloidae]